MVPELVSYISATTGNNFEEDAGGHMHPMRCRQASEQGLHTPLLSWVGFLLMLQFFSSCLCQVLGQLVQLRSALSGSRGSSWRRFPQMPVPPASLSGEDCTSLKQVKYEVGNCSVSGQGSFQVGFLPA